MKILLLFLFTSSFIFAINLPSSTILNSLSKNKTWRALLHYNNDNHTTIINQDFFLSIHGKYNALDELVATITSYKKILKNGEYAECKYPARYLWLSTYLNIDMSHIDNRCKKLSQWDLNTNVTSISAMFVSGFLGNPASAFGHSFFKINKKGKLNQSLLNDTISYGAILPRKYTMLSYLYNGISGGYEASYSDKYFYMDNMVYSNQEFRNMWEYEIHLSERKKKLFLYHIWELRGIHFPYYFFNKNCGYYATELLDVVSEKKMMGSAKIWYAPIETFYKLLSSFPIDNIHYYPSMQERIYQTFLQFSKQEKKIIESMIYNKSYKNTYILNEKKQANILDFVLEFFNYKLKSTSFNSVEYIDTKNIRNYYLLKRMKMPMFKYEPIDLVPPRPITDSNKPISLSIDTSLVNKIKTLKITYSPFNIDAVGYNNYRGDILTILNTSLVLSTKKVKMNEVDILKIRRLKIKQLPFDIDNPMSWMFNLGYTNNEKKDYFIKAGIGYSWNIFNDNKFYIMSNVSMHSAYTRYRINPYIGLFLDYKTFKLDVSYGIENRISNRVKDDTLNLAVQYQKNAHKAIYFKYKKNTVESLSLGVKWYF